MDFEVHEKFFLDNYGVENTGAEQAQEPRRNYVLKTLIVCTNGECKFHQRWIDGTAVPLARARIACLRAGHDHVHICRLCKKVVKWAKVGHENDAELRTHRSDGECIVEAMVVRCSDPPPKPRKMTTWQRLQQNGYVVIERVLSNADVDSLEKFANNSGQSTVIFNKSIYEVDEMIADGEDLGLTGRWAHKLPSFVYLPVSMPSLSGSTMYAMGKWFLFTRVTNISCSYWIVSHLMSVPLSRHRK